MGLKLKNWRLCMDFHRKKILNSIYWSTQDSRNYWNFRFWKNWSIKIPGPLIEHFIRPNYQSFNKNRHYNFYYYFSKLSLKKTFQAWIWIKNLLYIPNLFLFLCFVGYLLTSLLCFFADLEKNLNFFLNFYSFFNFISGMQ